MRRWGFIYTLGDETEPVRTERLGSPACELLCVGVPRIEDAPAAARRLVDQGAQLIELCGAFGGPGLAAVVAAVDGRAPVGAVFYGGDASTGLHELFGKRAPMDAAKLKELATRYTAAWCSQNAASVAAFFAANGSLKINDGEPSVGRSAITAAVQGFMTAFPDLVVAMDGLALDGREALYRWTLTGTNTGPGGTGNTVRISGHEEWSLGADGLIAESRGHFDEAEYDGQLGRESSA